MSLEHLHSMMFGGLISGYPSGCREATQRILSSGRSGAPVRRSLAKLGSDEVLGRRPSDSPLLLQVGTDCIEKPVNIDRDVPAEAESRWWRREPTFTEPNKTGGPFEFLCRAAFSM